MSVRESEKLLPAASAADLGEASAAILPWPGYTLVSYLTSPLRQNSRQDYVLFALGGAAADEYRWRVETVPPGTLLSSRTTDAGVFDWTPAALGDVTVSVEIIVSGAVVATVSLNQTVQAPAAAVEAKAGLLGADQLDTLRELVNDLKGYIAVATAVTGGTGIPDVVLAAVLFNEALSRPKEGTAGAARIRASSDVDNIRDVELAEMAERYDAVIPIHYFYSRKTLGVGQIAQTTAAMVLGLTPWRDLPAAHSARPAVLEQIEDDYDALPFNTRLAIFNKLRFPKTNVALAAQLLTKLKNRPHRWLTTPRSSLTSTPNAVEVITTEYNTGSTATPAVPSSSGLPVATPNWYGRQVRRLITPGAYPGDLPGFFP